jgi:RNA polymerase sigma-70 factor, ECF subfamily
MTALSNASSSNTRRPLPDFPRFLRRAQDGDEHAFALLWRHFNPMVLRYLRVMAGSASEDLAAETWLQVATSIRQFEGDEPGFRSWIFTIARYRQIDWHRKRGRRLEVPMGDSGIDPTSGNDETFELTDENMSLERALTTIALLPPDQAEAVMLRIVAGLDVARVADMMGRSQGSVRVLTHRGLRRLARFKADEAVGSEQKSNV